MDIRIVKIEDFEGYGCCSSCGREDLRWIATLSDGTQVGMECAKRILGFRPSPKAYNWVSDFRPVAEHTEHGSTYVMWQHKTCNQTRETRDGVLVSVGGIRQDWRRHGWAA
jgi:hypothetical protein